MRKLVPLVALSGCLPPLEDTGSTDDLATEVRSFSANCDTVEHLQVRATVGGVAVGSAILDLWDSGTPYGWNEEHRFAISSAVTQTLGTGTAGETDDTAGPAVETVTSLEMGLTFTTAQDAVGDSAPGTGLTNLSCQPSGVFDLGRATYALRAYDAEGDLLVCAATGFDDASIAQGGYSVTGGPPSNESELAECQVSSF
jgi:hypothetical protein